MEYTNNGRSFPSSEAAQTALKPSGEITQALLGLHSATQMLAEALKHLEKSLGSCLLPPKSDDSTASSRDPYESKLALCIAAEEAQVMEALRQVTLLTQRVAL